MYAIRLHKLRPSLMTCVLLTPALAIAAPKTRPVDPFSVPLPPAPPPTYTPPPVSDNVQKFEDATDKANADVIVAFNAMVCNLRSENYYY